MDCMIISLMSLSKFTVCGVFVCCFVVGGVVFWCGFFSLFFGFGGSFAVILSI